MHNDTFNPSYTTQTEWLRSKAALVGPVSMEKWMRKKGYNFYYTFYVIFGRRPKSKYNFAKDIK